MLCIQSKVIFTHFKKGFCLGCPPSLFIKGWVGLQPGRHSLLISWLSRCGKCSLSEKGVWRKKDRVTLPFHTNSVLLSFFNSRGEQWNHGALWYSRVRYTLDKNNKLFTGRDLDWFERDSKIGPLFPTCEDLGVPTITGRLGSSIEGGGKRNSRCLQLKGQQFLINLPSLRYKKQQTTCLCPKRRAEEEGSHRAAINKQHRSSYSVVNSGLRITITS